MTRIDVTTRALLGLSGLLASSLAAAGPPASPPASPPAASRPASDPVALGWIPEPGAPAACAMLQPVIAAQEAARLALQHPGELPRPVLDCPDGQSPLPVAQDATLLVRVPGSPPTAEWRVRAHGRVRPGLVAARLDFEPFDDRADAEPESPFGPLRADGPVAILPRPVLDHSRRGAGSRFNVLPEPAPAPQLPSLVVEELPGGAREDALVASLDRTTWVSLRLGGDQPHLRFALRPENVFGGDGRLIVAPRALQPDADTNVLLVDPATRVVTSLGRPATKEAGHYLRVTDARERAGVVEVLVVVDQLDGRSLTSAWGFLARRVGETWMVGHHVFTPAPDGLLARLRFDEHAADKMWLVAGDTRFSRPLTAPAANAAPRAVEKPPQRP